MFFCSVTVTMLLYLILTVPSSSEFILVILTIGKCLSLQIDKEEVSLRRVIGAKKDQYFLDKKMVT